MNQTNDINKIIERTTRRLRFFSQWYCTLTDEERNSWLGMWIMERATIFTGIINDIMKMQARASRSTGNYTPEK